MIVFEMIREALRNLSRHKLRSFLTALGIIFGIASVMAMVSSGEGARRKILAEIGELGIRNIIISSVKPPASQKVTKDENADILRYGLTFKDLHQIRETVPLVVRALPVHERQTWVWLGSQRLSASLRGVRTAYLDNLKLKPFLGRTLTELDDADRRRVCLVRTRLLRELRYAGDPLQLDLRIGRDIYRVVGVLPDYDFHSMSQTVLGVDDRQFEVYAPFNTIVDRLGFTKFEYTGSSSENTYVELHQLLCEARSEGEVLEAAKCLQAILEHNHPKKDYQMTVPLELLVSRQRTQQVFDIVLTIIAGISLVVGGIGILNIMLASVTERTREIGIRRAIGATQLDVTTQFLIETVTLAAIGGILGVALGIAGALVLGQFTDWQPVITPWAVGLSIAISCTTGVLFGMYPARRAAQMNPIEALRYQ